jgi:electron transport complex protein RnfE
LAGEERAEVKSGEFRRILWRDNPLLVYLVGLCPALAVSNRLSNALLLAAVMLFALLGTGIAAVALERWVPPRLRLPVRLVLASALVTAAQRFLWAFAPTHAAGLGIYLPLLAVNCLLLASSASGSLGQSAAEAAGRGAAFAVGLGLLALVREILGRHNHALSHRFVRRSAAPARLPRAGPPRRPGRCWFWGT